MRYKVRVLPWVEASNIYEKYGVASYNWKSLWKPHKYYEVEYAKIINGKVLYPVSTEHGEYFTINLPRNVLIMSQHDSVCMLKDAVMHR